MRMAQAPPASAPKVAPKVAATSPEPVLEASTAADSETSAIVAVYQLLPKPRPKPAKTAIPRPLTQAGEAYGYTSFLRDVTTSAMPYSAPDMPTRHEPAIRWCSAKFVDTVAQHDISTVPVPCSVMSFQTNLATVMQKHVLKPMSKRIASRTRRHIHKYIDTSSCKTICVDVETDWQTTAESEHRAHIETHPEVDCVTQLSISLQRTSHKAVRESAVTCIGTSSVTRMSTARLVHVPTDISDSAATSPVAGGSMPMLRCLSMSPDTAVQQSA